MVLVAAVRPGAEKLCAMYGTDARRSDGIHGKCTRAPSHAFQPSAVVSVREPVPAGCHEVPGLTGVDHRDMPPPVVKPRSRNASFTPTILPRSQGSGCGGTSQRAERFFGCSVRSPLPTSAGSCATMGPLQALWKGAITDGECNGLHRYRFLHCKIYTNPVRLHRRRAALSASPCAVSLRTAPDCGEWDGKALGRCGVECGEFTAPDGLVHLFSYPARNLVLSPGLGDFSSPIGGVSIPYGGGP